MTVQSPTRTTTPLDYSSLPTSGSWLTQTWALVVDAYRELNARKMFWITMVLSAGVVLIFSIISINAQGVKILVWQIPGTPTTAAIPAELFYKTMFTDVGVPWWLNLLATILALVSVCSIFPDFLSGGSIDLYLSRPISRLRLFFTKYILGLMFVGLQVLVFSTCCFLLIGLRSSVWDWRIFLAVPLVSLFFSYLFCVMVLLGILTRSAIASLLITVLLWGALFLINLTDGIMLSVRAMTEERVVKQQSIVEGWQGVVDENQRIGGGNQDTFKRYLADSQTKLTEFQDNAATVAKWHKLVRYVQAPLPKTSETSALINRWLVPVDAWDSFQEKQYAEHEQRRQRFRKAPPTTQVAAEMRPDSPEVQRRIIREVRSRSAGYIIGTSVAFEAVVLAVSAWIFSRRDF